MTLNRAHAHYYSTSITSSSGGGKKEGSVRLGKKKKSAADLDSMSPYELAKHYGYDPDAKFYHPEASVM